MKDRVASKAIQSFYDVLVDLHTGLTDLDVRCDWVGDMLAHTEEEPRGKQVAAWLQHVESQLVKGRAKYRTAVTSIVKEPASVYHAIRYRDVVAMEEASEFWAKVDCRACAKASPLFWEYLDELTEEAYTMSRKAPPKVPTSDEIARDIAERKSGKGGRSGGGEAVLGLGAYDIMCGMCATRKVAPPEAESFNQTIAGLLSSGCVTIDACRRRECGGAIVDAFPQLNPIAEAEWEGVAKILSLSTMESAIPNDMMKGIESVASQLVKDISAGKATLDSLNVEDIGQRVLSGVSTQDMEAFTKNIDKIIPAIQNMNLSDNAK